MRQLREGYEFLRQNCYILPLGISWSLFISGMWTQGILTAPLSDRLLHAGASGYGHLNAAWAIGAFLSTTYSALMIRSLGGRKTVAITMALLGICLFVLPFSHFMLVAAATYCVMGSARGDQRPEVALVAGADRDVGGDDDLLLADDRVRVIALDEPARCLDRPRVGIGDIDPAARRDHSAADLASGTSAVASGVRSKPMYSAASSGLANMIVRSSSWIMRP